LDRSAVYAALEDVLSLLRTLENRNILNYKIFIKDGYYCYVEKAIRQYFKGFEGVGMRLVFKRHHPRQESRK